MRYPMVPATSTRPNAPSANLIRRTVSTHGLWHLALRSLTFLPVRRFAEELRAGRVAEPVLELLRCPLAFVGQQQPGVRMVERPEDVGCPADVEAGAQRVPRVQRLHDRALVGVEVGLDQRPERRGVGVD